MLCCRLCLNDIGLFPSFKEVLETEMAKSSQIIVREYNRPISRISNSF